MPGEGEPRAAAARAGTDRSRSRVAEPSPISTVAARPGGPSPAVGSRRRSARRHRRRTGRRAPRESMSGYDSCGPVPNQAARRAAVAGRTGRRPVARCSPRRATDDLDPQRRGRHPRRGPAVGGVDEQHSGRRRAADAYDQSGSPGGSTATTRWLSRSSPRSRQRRSDDGPERPRRRSRPDRPARTSPASRTGRCRSDRATAPAADRRPAGRTDSAADPWRVEDAGSDRAHRRPPCRAAADVHVGRGGRAGRAAEVELGAGHHVPRAAQAVSAASSAATVSQVSPVPAGPAARPAAPVTTPRPPARSAPPARSPRPSVRRARRPRRTAGERCRRVW